MTFNNPGKIVWVTKLPKETIAWYRWSGLQTCKLDRSARVVLTLAWWCTFCSLIFILTSKVGFIMRAAASQLLCRAGPCGLVIIIFFMLHIRGDSEWWCIDDDGGTQWKVFFFLSRYTYVVMVWVIVHWWLRCVTALRPLNILLVVYDGTAAPAGMCSYNSGGIWPPDS